MSEIFLREFYRMQDEINERDQKIAELETEMKNADWINKKSRKEIDRLNEQIKSAYIGDEQCEMVAELRLDLAKARAEIHRLNGLLDKKDTDAYTLSGKQEEIRNLKTELNEAYEEVNMLCEALKEAGQHNKKLSGIAREAGRSRDQLQRKNDELINQLEDIINNNDKE